MSGDAPTGCGSPSCIIAPARVGAAVCSCLNELTPALRVPLRAVVAGLRAESTVLASVVEALDDSARPEESPVDAVRRLRAELARLTPDTPGAVSDHVRSRFAEASAATLAGEGGCIGAGCLPAHQACEVLDAYDDARAEVERLTEQEGDDAHERLRKIAEPIQREVCERRARDHSPRYGSNEAAARVARAIAKAEGWDCYPEDSTTDEPGGDQ